MLKTLSSPELEAQVTTARPGEHGSAWRWPCTGKGMGVTSLERGSASRAQGRSVPRATAAREGFLPFFWGDAGGHGAKGRSYWVAALGCSSMYPPALCTFVTGEMDGEGAGLGKATKCTKQAQISYLRHCRVSSRNIQR